jgi:hypothetical protein
VIEYLASSTNIDPVALRNVCLPQHSVAGLVKEFGTGFIVILPTGAPNK